MTVRSRRYTETHPWLNFKFDMGGLAWQSWRLMGETEASCDHLAGTPLNPEVAAELHKVYLTKGVLGTTHIEGNTLTEEEIRKIVDGASEVPPSREYMELEAQNIIAAYNTIIRERMDGGPATTLPMTLERIKAYNSMVLNGLEDHLDPGVVPGEFSERQVVVANYVGAPPEDLDYLVDRLCGLLNEDFDPSRYADEWHYPLAITKAILAHLYLVWIHPFGDGNGRTARLMEFHILLENGVPLPAAHLLSDHYNRTRTEYYRQLRATSRNPDAIRELINYSLQGFVDGLQDQLRQVRALQMEVAWKNFVHEAFEGLHTPPHRRRRSLVLSLPMNEEWVPRSEIPSLSVALAKAYAGKQTKTVTRDINALTTMGLIRKRRTMIQSRFGDLQAFLPFRFDSEEGNSEAS